MRKLHADDIVILGEGPQIRKYIEANYGRVEDFYESNNFPVSLKSVRTYLSQDKVQSDTFKHAIVRTLDKGYNELVKSKTAQIKEYVHIINVSIILYKDEEDYLLFDKLHELCKENELCVETAVMYRVRAMNCYYRALAIQSIEYYEAAIKCIGDYDSDLLVLFLVELADAYYRENMLIKAEREYKRAEEYVSKSSAISDRTLFKYYYWRGIMLNNTGKHEKAREGFFSNAYKYTNDKREKAAAMYYIGLTYKREKKNEEALEQYNKLLNYYDDDDYTGKALVYNNIAYFHLELGELSIALENSIKALALILLTQNVHNRLTILHTYTLIKLTMGDIEACNDYIKALRDTFNKEINKKRIIKDIMSIVDILNDSAMLEQLVTVLNFLIDTTTNANYVKELYMCIGKIYKKIMN